MARGFRGRRRKNGAAGEHEESQEATRLMNSGARAELIRTAARYITDRQAEIKTIQEDINEYKQTHIKGDLGFKLSDFAVVLRVYKLEGEDRDTLLDTIREGFAALGVGGQLDWITEAEKADAKAAEFDA